MQNVQLGRSRGRGRGGPPGCSQSAPSPLPFNAASRVGARMSCSSEWSERLRLRCAQARPPTPPSPPPLPSSPTTDAGTSNGNGARTVAPTEGSPTSSPSLTAALVRARNGVGNTKSQNEELKIRVSAIRPACQELSPNETYEMALTFIVFQNRHDTRLMPASNQDGVGKCYNVPPGTIVDSLATHPLDFDFTSAATSALSQ
ncbi:uncharacterized protein LOC144102618 [Amblyomma americanum]